MASVADHTTSRCSRWVRQATIAVPRIRKPTAIASPWCAHSAKIWSAEYGKLAMISGWRNGIQVP